MINYISFRVVTKSGIRTYPSIRNIHGIIRIRPTSLNRSFYTRNSLRNIKDVSKEETTRQLGSDTFGSKPVDFQSGKGAVGSSNTFEDPVVDEKPFGTQEAEIPHQDDFLTTVFENMEPYMDTYSVYNQLTKAGFTGEQADKILDLLIMQLNSKLSKLPTKYSQLYELENERYLFESAQQELRVDVTRSREQHINELISLINILQRDFHIISDELNSDFIQMKNDSQVAINDQKSDNTLLSKRIILKIQETNHKITTELNSAMRSEIESLRWHLSRWGLIAILVSVFSGCSVFYAQKAKYNREEHARSDFVPLVIYEPSDIEDDEYDTDLDRSVG